MSPIPVFNTVNQFPKDVAHTAHVATSRDSAPDGDTKAPRPEERDTAQPMACDFVEPGASIRRAE